MTGPAGAPAMLRAAAAGLAIALALPLVFPFYSLVPLAAYALLALSLAWVWGFAGILCFGQGAFFGLGAYAYAISAINAGDGSLGVLMAVLVPAAAAAALGAFMFYGRLSDVYLAVVTLVFTLILFRFLNSTAGPEYAIGSARLGGFNGIPGFPTITLPGSDDAFISERALYGIAAGSLLAILLLLRWMLGTTFGRVCQAVRENELRCELAGYDVRLVKTAAFALGGAIAGLGGCVFANWAEIVTPGLFALSFSAEAIVWVLIGGLGSLAGPALAAAILGYLKFLLGQQSAIDNLLVMGVILVLVVLLLPRGLAAALGRLWDMRRADPAGGAQRPRPVAGRAGH